uniref:Uncharacterized protein n=1 Tax=Cacopsylla melanoneura TaxID=428564 RepID=A0A8D8QRY7_9HEMI
MRQLKAWETIAQKLWDRGFPMPDCPSMREAAKRAKSKWDNLMRKQNEYKRNQRATGSATRPEPKYYNEMLEATSAFHNVNPVVSLDTLDTATSSTQNVSGNPVLPEDSLDTDAVSSGQAASLSVPSTSTSGPQSSTGRFKKPKKLSRMEEQAKLTMESISVQKKTNEMIEALIASREEDRRQRETINQDMKTHREKMAKLLESLLNQKKSKKRCRSPCSDSD